MNVQSPFNSNTMTHINNVGNGWIIDSGANQHMTSSYMFLENIVDITNFNITVGHPNGTIARINKIGNLRLTNNVVLFDVLVVPDYCVSLLSVHKIARDSKLFIGFDEHKCYIQDLTQNKFMGTGVRRMDYIFF